ncbi:MAG: hypothetical protein RLZZ292_1242 [Bacteroidota bacterium]
MQVTLDIPNQNAWQALQPLIQYLHINIVEVAKPAIIENDPMALLQQFIKPRSAEEQTALEELTQKGCEINNFDTFIREWNDNRQDNTLP